MKTRECTDVIDLLVADHNEAKSLLMRFDHLDAAGRETSFRELVQTLVSHERAEEEVVYPTLRRHALHGDAIADARLAEQAEVEDVLSELEHLDMGDQRFVELFAALRASVLEHADREEREAFPVLRASVGDEELDELGRCYVRARAAAPSHPLPLAHGSVPGKVLVEPIVAVVNHLRDAVRAKP